MRHTVSSQVMEVHHLREVTPAVALQVALAVKTCQKVQPEAFILVTLRETSSGKNFDIYVNRTANVVVLGTKESQAFDMLIELIDAHVDA